MGSFDTGMRLGMQAYDTAQQNKRQKKLDERADKAYARQEKQWDAEDEADRNLAALSTKGVRNEAGIKANDDDFEMAVQATGLGLPMPAATPQAAEWTPATELDMNVGMQGVARARKDYNGLMALQDKHKNLKWDTMFGERLKGYTGAEDQIGEAVQYVNNKSKRISMGDPDDKGEIRMSVVKPNGRADFLNLTKQDQAQIYAAAGMMEIDPIKALTIMAGVNKELASAYAADNNIEFKIGEFRGQAATRAETKRHNEAGEKNDSARTRVMADAYRRTAEAKQPDPELVKKLNDIVQQHDAETDPKKRAALEQKHRLVTAQLATQMGKPMQLNSGGRSNALADWDAVERELMKSNTPPAEIQIQKEHYLARQGYAPSAAVQVLFSGRGPDGEKLTEAEVDDFNRMFPHTPVDKTVLPWLKPKTGAPNRTGTWGQPEGGMFTGKNGETQLLQPLYDGGAYVADRVTGLEALRKRLQEQSAGQ